jgi:pimeloyl-ACP methyl ester carboxylesterase
MILLDAGTILTSLAMPRILCFHGKSQNSGIFSNKIAGARRKLERVYDLTFLDAPIRLDEMEARAWWSDDKNVQKAFEYVVEQTNGESYDALLGFSQGGSLATALAGAIPGIQAVVTAGSPMVKEVFDTAKVLMGEEKWQQGLLIPKLHLAGETDQLVGMTSTLTLCEIGGSGELYVHEQGHLFPTRARIVNHVLDFLAANIRSLVDETSLSLGTS